ncbi:uncharacterized protein BJ171DRAFT_280072 [Polychytrium aggregatum]|uniref:uncharacterized protein n=1 Tax=Polychytrium aggregatum TaxID=110093 RepID=UPI0022FF40CB|nr:uncharacterized protein BJ171DRAFT_280072 [Polychytrium aggregatum]KAI9207698.1 hypothetical protein BJ171DRAFT_280072 [Polychytrium aggregatum]
MSKPTQRKGKGSKKESQKPLLEISEEEQRRIIEQTGILHKLKDSSDNSHGDADADADADADSELEQDPSFEGLPIYVQTLVIGIPLSVLYVGLDYLLHVQYDVLSSFYSLDRVVQAHLPTIVSLFVVIYISSLFKKLFVTQVAFTLGSIYAGYSLVYISVEDDRLGQMLKTPGIAALWIYMTIQMRLEFAMLSGLIVYLYYNRGWFTGENSIASNLN